MDYRSKILEIADYEASTPPTNWNDSPDTILEYFKLSTGLDTTMNSALQVSWCSYFVHWCVDQAGLKNKVKVGPPEKLGSMGSVGRFRRSQGGAFQDYAVAYKKYVPKPGDLYNRASPNNHIGIVADVKMVGKRVMIQSYDGNSGPQWFSEYFHKGKRTLGYGFVNYRSVWFELTGANDWWMSLSD